MDSKYVLGLGILFLIVLLIIFRKVCSLSTVGEGFVNSPCITDTTWPARQAKDFDKPTRRWGVKYDSTGCQINPDLSDQEEWLKIRDKYTTFQEKSERWKHLFPINMDLPSLFCHYENPSLMTPNQLETFRKQAMFSKMTMTDYHNWLKANRKELPLMNPIHWNNYQLWMAGQPIEIPIYLDNAPISARGAYEEMLGSCLIPKKCPAEFTPDDKVQPLDSPMNACPCPLNPPNPSNVFVTPKNMVLEDPKILPIPPIAP